MNKETKNGLRGPSFWQRLKVRVEETNPLGKALIAVVGIVAIIIIVVFSSPRAPSGTIIATPSFSTRVAAENSPTHSTSPTPISTRTPIQTPSPVATPPPLVIPTPSANALLLAFSPNPDQTGWVGRNELRPHWRDRNLQSGMYGGQPLISLVQFDLTRLAPGSKIVYAVFEITGRNAKYLGDQGDWRFDLVAREVGSEWGDVSYDTAHQAPSLMTLGILPSRNLGSGLVNRFVFNENQLRVIEKQLEDGLVTFRMSGPSEGSDNLFMWEAGPGLGEPTLYVVVVPASFAVITPTPTPVDLFAAATLVAQQTVQARAFGTPTPLPRVYVTATPAPLVSGNVVITSIPTPANTTARTATALYATAVAATTGTFTPMPFNWVTATPMPLLIPRELLTPVPRPTSTPAPVSPIDWAKRPLPSILYNKIIFLEGPRAGPNVWVMDPDGSNMQLLTDRQYHYIAKARDAISPNGISYVYNAPDDQLRMQIWSQDLRYPQFPPQQLTSFSRANSLTFAPSWAPDGTKLAFTNDSSGRQEIYIYDVDLRTYKPVTNSSGSCWWNQFPSWSPDGKKIVYSSDCGHDGTFSEIWVMDANGGNAHNLGDGVLDAYNPVWVKWQQ